MDILKETKVYINGTKDYKKYYDALVAQGFTITNDKIVEVPKYGCTIGMNIVEALEATDVIVLLPEYAKDPRSLCVYHYALRNNKKIIDISDFENFKF